MRIKFDGPHFEKEGGTCTRNSRRFERMEKNEKEQEIISKKRTEGERRRK